MRLGGGIIPFSFLNISLYTSRARWKGSWKPQFLQAVNYVTSPWKGVQNSLDPVPCSRKIIAWELVLWKVDCGAAGRFPWWHLEQEPTLPPSSTVTLKQFQKYLPKTWLTCSSCGLHTCRLVRKTAGHIDLRLTNPKLHIHVATINLVKMPLWLSENFMKKGT